MQAFFDQLQHSLIDLLETPQQNTVGHFANQTFFAGGGLAGDKLLEEKVTDDNSMKSEANSLGIIQRIANAANSTFNNASEPNAGQGKYGDSPLGQGFYNSAPYIAQHYTQLGKFFSGGEPGNFYTNRYEQPTKNQPVKGEDPNKFYSLWYESMRRFAEASEIADRGQTITRTR